MGYCDYEYAFSSVLGFNKKEKKTTYTLLPTYSTFHIHIVCSILISNDGINICKSKTP